MDPLLLIQIFQGIQLAIQAGGDVVGLLDEITDRLTAANAAGTPLTEDDWAFLDLKAATNLAEIKGYTSLTHAVIAAQSLAVPQKGAAEVAAPTLAPLVQEAAGSGTSAG